MDAAKTSFSRTAFLFSLALLIPASAFSQTTAFSPSLTSITLVGRMSQTDTISSTTSTPITFSATTKYAAGDPAWLTIDAGASTDHIGGLVTTANLYVLVGQQANSSQFTPGLHTASIILHATDASGAPDVAISVSYNTGSNGGATAGTLSASPSSPSASTAYQGSTVLYFNLVSSSTTPIAFTLQTPAVSWATNFVTSNGSSTTGTVSSGSSVQVQVTLNGFGQAYTTLSTTLSVAYGNNTLSIPITFGNGVNAGSGSGGTGTLQFSPSSVSWTYTTGGTFPFQTGINVSSTTNAATFTATATSTNSWLAVVPTSGTLPNTLTVEPTSNIGSLATGGYTGTVTVFGSDGSQQSFNVNLVVNGGTTNGLTISPNPVSLQTALNGSIVQQSVTVTSAAGGSLSAVVSGTGLTSSVSNSNIVAGVSSTAITVTGNPAGLGNGTYVGSLTVTVGGVSQAVQVNFIVGTGSGGNGGSTGSISAAPSAVNFVYQVNSSMQPNQQQYIFLAGSGNYTAAVTSSGGGTWLSVPTTSGVLPSQYAQIVTNASGLAAGTYTGAVTFTNSSTNQTAVVSVNLQVTGSTAIYTSPGDLVFSYIASATSATQFQSLFLIASDGSAIPVTAAVSNPSNSPWLSITSNGSSIAGLAAYSVTVNASNLANGLYTGYITVTAATGNSPITVPVALNVVGSSTGGGGGSLTLGTSSLTFQVALNGLATTQQLSVSAINATSFSASASTNNGNSTWLSVSPAGSSVTNTTLTVTGNPAGLAAGTYSGVITLISGSGTQTVPVTMIVGSGGGTGGNITVTANGVSSTSPSLTFTAQSLGAPVTAQYLTVTSASGSSAVSFAASLSGSSCSWVALGINTTQSYQTPLNNLNVGATTTGLAAGTYSCTLTLTPTGGTAVTVPLTLTVVGTPTISISVTSLSFSYSAGSAAPSAQTVTVTGAGSAAASFTASATGTPAGWLSVSPASGTASVGSPASLSVNVNPAGLAAGTYTGTVSVAAGTGTTGSGTVTVTLTVTAPTPAITTIVNGASFLGGAVSPGEFVTIMGTSLGPLTPLGPAIDSTGKVATTLGNVQVFFSATPAPLTYVSSGQINCIVPYGVSGLSTVPIQVKFLAQPSNVVTQSVQNSAPGIFTATGTGTGQGSILNQNFTLNTSGNPAAKGSIVQIYMTGEGVTSPPGTDGAITANATTVPVLPIAVMIGGQPATVIFKGEAPGIVAGVLQLNVMIPPTVSSGVNQVSVTIGSNTSQPNLTVAVQ
jgi:trimeric autotransporter adhesin